MTTPPKAQHQKAQAVLSFPQFPPPIAAVVIVTELAKMIE
jgi:hypothetical protein